MPIYVKEFLPGSSNMNTKEVDIEEDKIPIEIERSKASHKINVINSSTKHNKESQPIKIKEAITEEKDEPKDQEDKDLSYVLYDKRNILKLTRTSWLTENDDSSYKFRNALTGAKSNSRKRTQQKNLQSSTSLSQSSSASSIVEDLDEQNENKAPKENICDKHLSTIINLDKEHNLFGLANLPMINSDVTWKSDRKHGNKTIFPQNTIVLVCCTSGCCRHRSNTDLPTSLKCGGCGTCKFCAPCSKPICNHNSTKTSKTSTVSFRQVKSCRSCCSSPINCKLPCLSRCCDTNCAYCRGFKIVLKKKPVYKAEPIEIASRAPSILQKPAAARTCTHTPACIPPSSCFPYLMPCYWPASPSAPCSNPTRCFHNPPCLPPRIHRETLDTQKCFPSSQGAQNKPVNKRNKTCCSLGCSKKKEICSTSCACSRPICKGCFVYYPKKKNAITEQNQISFHDKIN